MLSSIALACKQISSLVTRAGVSNLTGVAGAANSSVGNCLCPFSTIDKLFHAVLSMVLSRQAIGPLPPSLGGEDFSKDDDSADEHQLKLCLLQSTSVPIPLYKEFFQNDLLGRVRTRRNWMWFPMTCSAMHSGAAAALEQLHPRRKICPSQLKRPTLVDCLPLLDQQSKTISFVVPPIGKPHRQPWYSLT